MDKGFGKNEPVDVVVRPEDIYLMEPGKGMISGKVISTIFKGVHYEMMIQCGDYEWMVQDTTMYKPGSEVGLFIRPYDIHIMKKSDVPLYSDEIYERSSLKKRRAKMNRKAFAYPYIVWMGIFIIVPMAMVVVCAFTTDFRSGDFTFTLANFDRLINSELNYVEVFVRSIKLALICTVICLAIGYPVSYIIADRKMKLPSLLIIMFIMPMWMNFLLRTYAIRHILNTVPFLTGLMATEGGVVLGMVYNYLPFMILPIYSSLTKLDTSLTEAASDLGASPAAFSGGLCCLCPCRA